MDQKSNYSNAYILKPKLLLNVNLKGVFQCLNYIIYIVMKVATLKMIK